MQTGSRKQPDCAGAGESVGAGGRSPSKGAPAFLVVLLAVLLVAEVGVWYHFHSRNVARRQAQAAALARSPEPPPIEGERERRDQDQDQDLDLDGDGSVSATDIRLFLMSGRPEAPPAP